MNCNATIILGAGASIDFVNEHHLTSGDILRQILSQNAWQNLFNKQCKHIDRTPNIEHIVKLLEQISYEVSNFEDLIEIVDKVSTLSNPNKFTDSLLVKSLKHVDNIQIGDINDNLELINLPFYIRELISDFVTTYNTSLLTNYSIERLEEQTIFLKTLSQWCDKLSIHSMNYDDCIMHSASKLEIGNYFDAIGKFDKEAFMSAKKVLTHLHGSPHFVPVYQYIAGDSSIVRFTNYTSDASDERWKIARIHTGLYTNGIVCPDFNHYITTGRSKGSHFYNQPYSAYYSRLINDIDQSDIILIVGYSFGDQHINQLLKGNKKALIIVVDFESDTNAYANNIYKLIDILDCRFFDSYDNSNIRFITEQLKYRGYSKIDYSNIIYYRKGYLSFLREYKMILQEYSSI